MTKNQSKEGNTSPIDSNESAQRLEAIKNLIFGDNIQQIDTEFESIKVHIENRKKELEGIIDDIHKELSTTIDNLSTELNIRITDFEDKLSQKTDELNNNKIDKNLLGSLLVSMGEKIMKD